MSDLFQSKNIKPMLIGAEREPFNSENYLYELKLDGERCVAYLDPARTELRNKRNMKMLPKVPELSNLHSHVSRRCILDGELIVMKNGKLDFFEIQRRSLMSNPLKIKFAVQQYPACFTAFDILYLDDHSVIDQPLTERKQLLQSVVNKESSNFAVSRVIEQHGIQFYELAKNQELEGIVAKHKNSQYFFDKRTSDWIKIKFLKDDDFVICGYIQKENNVTSIVLGQYLNGVLTDQGHVTLGISSESFEKISQAPKADIPPFNSDEDAVWLVPQLVCTVKFMMRTHSGSLRQPVFKGIREDKTPQECIGM